MGFTYYELVPAAILFDNPGLTAVEWADKVYEFRQVGGTYGRHLHGLAEILRLPITKSFLAYTKQQSRKKDDNNLELLPIHFYTESSKEEDGKIIYLDCPEYHVSEHIKNLLSAKQRKEEYTPGTIKVGELLDTWHGALLLVNKILSKKRISKDKWEPNFIYNIIAQEVTQLGNEHTFHNLDDLIQKFPQFDPYFMYDFSTSSGIISTECYRSHFYWQNKEGRYYIDEEMTFNNIPERLRTYDEKDNLVRELGYTDLILTAEAVKKKDFSVIGYQHPPDRNLQKFLVRNPDSYKRYQKAVWDSHSSIFAKSQNWTNSQLLRWRVAKGALKLDEIDSE